MGSDLPGVFERVYGVDYFRYRAELQRIAQSSLEAVEGAIITAGFEDFEDWFYDDTEEFVFPIDDDDLFAPNLADALSDISDDTALVVWPHAKAGFVEFKPPPAVKRKKNPTLDPNNWGVRKSFVRETLTLDDAKLFFARHMVAQEHTVRTLDIASKRDAPSKATKFQPLFHPRVKVPPEAFGLNYMHPGSLQFFSTLAKDGSPEEAYRDYRPDTEFAVPEYLDWAKPYLEAYRTAIPRLREEVTERSEV